MQEQHLSDFDFELPPELIAQYPLENRTASRLLHVTKDVIEDGTFTDIEGFLHDGDLLVANNTKVIKARLLGRKATGGSVEALIERVTGRTQRHFNGSREQVSEARHRPLLRGGRTRGARPW